MKNLTTKVSFLLWIIGIMIFFAACKKTSTPAATFLQPDLAEDKMIAVLLDIHLAEAAVQTEKNTKKDSLLHLYYQDIYRIHNITQEDFERNLEAWFDNPEIADKLYEKVVESLNKSEADNFKKPIQPGAPAKLGD